MNKPDVHAFHDEATFTITYVVSDPATGLAAIVDPVLDYDPASGRTSTESADEVIAFVQARQLGVLWILETHVHADHAKESVVKPPSARTFPRSRRSSRGSSISRTSPPTADSSTTGLPMARRFQSVTSRQV